MSPSDTLRPILCVGLTPAYQRTLFFSSLRIGEINRARRLVTGAAGKGINVARALKQWGYPARALTFLGGETGQAIQTDLDAAGISYVATPTLHPTRICQTLIDEAAETATELIEESTCPSPEEWADLRLRYGQSVRDAALVVISGTLMPGASVEWYAELAGDAAERHVPVLIDSHGAPLVRSLAARPWLVKMNVHELEDTCGQTVLDEQDGLTAGRSLLDQGAQNVLITRGSAPAWWIQTNRMVRFELPRITPVSAIASGDCTSAGIAHATAQGAPLDKAICWGLACGTANALTALPARFDPATAKQYASAITVTEH